MKTLMKIDVLENNVSTVEQDKRMGPLDCHQLVIEYDGNEYNEPVARISFEPWRSVDDEPLTEEEQFTLPYFEVLMRPLLKAVKTIEPLVDSDYPELPPYNPMEDKVSDVSNELRGISEMLKEGLRDIRCSLKDLRPPEPPITPEP